ncbi:MAG: MSMEG_1061 family FMN-dependent PPOX-type flavoprotein [Solirubrobacteraceae bacterium]|jgi:PPOX class probable FMN-dependent enzyme
MDPFAAAISSEAELRALYEEPTPTSLRKDIGRLDEMCRALIAASPMVAVGSVDAHGRADVSPRGGPPGFVAVLDDHHLAIPDATGNRRLDTLANVVASGRAGLLFLIPGRDTTLRVSGRACVSCDADLLAALEAVGKPPRSALVVAAEEVFAHCPKAFIRSRLWDPASWGAPEALPSSAAVSHAHLRDPGLSVADVEAQQRESVLHRLA